MRNYSSSIAVSEYIIICIILLCIIRYPRLDSKPGVYITCMYIHKKLFCIRWENISSELLVKLNHAIVFPQFMINFEIIFIFRNTEA